MEVDESSLDSVFAECEKAYHRLSTEFFRGDDPVGKKLIADLESYSYLCESLIRKEHIFSINETVKDMNTEDIKYLMVGYYCGFVLQKGMEDRLTRLERAVSYLESFLDVLKRCEILDKDTELQYDAYLQSLIAYGIMHRRQEEHTKLDAGALRNEKIRRMKLEKDCDVRLKEIHTMQERKDKGSVVDEELEREKWVLALQSCARKSLNDLNSIPQEMEILKYMQSMKDTGKDPHQEFIRGYQEANKKPMEVIHIGTDLKMTKQTIRSSVFRPWWNLPTRSMADYAEEEMQHMREAEAAREAEGTPDKRYKQLEEEGLEDDAELVDRATIRDRHYDDMMDNISKGIGNTKRICNVCLNNQLI